MRKIKITSIVGARPNFVKIAPIMEEMSKHAKISQILVHTGQHYDFNMSKAFFKELSIPKPGIFLNVGSHSHGIQTGMILAKLEKVLLREKPDLVLVVGDVNSTLAGALCAVKLHIPVAHVEAGLRSFDRLMPEEINRILTDTVSDFLFTDSNDANVNLVNEGLDKKKIFYVGNVMIDTLLKYRRIAQDNNILQKLKLSKRSYCLLTLHRPENVDNLGIFREVLSAIEMIQNKIKVIFPMHPRTSKMILKMGMRGKLREMINLSCVGPLGYIEFLKLMQDSRLVLTDSGGVQEEATALNIPCLTLRHNTERPVTVAKGTNIVVGHDPKKILARVNMILLGHRKNAKQIKFWDGGTASRIVKIILKKF